MSALVRRLACLVALIVLALAATPARQPVRATNPCDSITGDPHPPAPQPEPLISGAILDDSTSTGVSGATVKLYRCQGSVAIYVTQTTSSSSGAYGFGGLTQNWYYVEAALTGPLAGKSPASGTSNPSDLIEVGQGVSGLTMAFE